MTEIIVALITGGLTLIGVIISNMSSNRKVQKDLEKSQAVTTEKVEELTREVRKHNNFAERVPVVELELKMANHRIADIENEIKDIKKES